MLWILLALRHHMRVPVMVWVTPGATGVDYHIELDGHYYSVPYPLVHELVDARLTATTVEIFHRGQRVAAHLRRDVRGTHTTDPAHMPKAHQRHLEWTPARIITWARTLGPATAALVDAILNPDDLTLARLHQREIALQNLEVRLPPHEPGRPARA